MKKVKTVALFSGGLDSILAVKLVLEEGIDVYPITFINPFSGFAKEGRRMSP